MDIVQDEMQKCISLKLDDISLQSLGWIIKSIRNDLMTPNEKLILSRIKVRFQNFIKLKECFAFKPNQKAWEKNAQNFKEKIIY